MAELRYGDVKRGIFRRKETRNTIWNTGHVDIQLSKDGRVLAVWFRCLELPFQYRTVSEEKAKSLEGERISTLPRIKAIIVDQP